MDILYFNSVPENTGKEDNGLLSHKKVLEGSIRKSKNMNSSIDKRSGLLIKNENKLLTDDGREIFNENV